MAKPTRKVSLLGVVMCFVLGAVIVVFGLKHNVHRDISKEGDNQGEVSIEEATELTKKVATEAHSKQLQFEEEDLDDTTLGASNTISPQTEEIKKNGDIESKQYENDKEVPRSLQMDKNEKNADNIALSEIIIPPKVEVEGSRETKVGEKSSPSTHDKNPNHKTGKSDGVATKSLDVTVARKEAAALGNDRISEVKEIFKLRMEAIDYLNKY